MVFAAVLPLLQYAPAVFEGARAIISAVTGDEVPPRAAQDPESMARHIDELPPVQRAEVVARLMSLKERIQRLDTERFLAMTDGSVEKLRATARPEIARRAMGVIETFAVVFKVVFFAIVLEWAVRNLASWTGVDLAETTSLPALFAELSPVAEMIWAPLLGSFWACVAIVRKYMGVRERDKAHEYELRNGGPLNSTQATIEAASGAIATAVRALRR
ncbi:MAG: hypothetical protein JJ899_03100 [Alphaproteobacteria bacterium]|nr:hypothetical protein [Alphaproteobacteria bacterium]